jgi:vesicle-fusing ATPase
MTIEARILLADDADSPDRALTAWLQGLQAALAGSTPSDAIVEALCSPPDTMLSLAAIFGLDETAVAILGLTAGQELDRGIAAALSRLTGSALTATALDALVPGAWDALCPGAPLRQWRLIEPFGAGPISTRDMRIDERILHYLRGTTYVDSRLDGMLRPVEADAPNARILDAWGRLGPLPLLLLAGDDSQSIRAGAAGAAASVGLLTYQMAASDIPTDWTQRSALAAFVDRELALSRAALLIEADEKTTAVAARFADLLFGPVMISAPEPEAWERAPRLRIDMPVSDRQTRVAQWREAVAGLGDVPDDTIQQLAAHFALDAVTITTAAGAGPDPDALWDAAREQGRRRLDAMAQRIDSHATWDDLVLPDEALAVLRDLSVTVAVSWKVGENWGWAARSSRGLGTTALFSGASGTGKTLAAEVIAAALRLDLYRIDLSQVVSKYIGETEKNLARIFAAAEAGGAILLFDEADALFGKRSEVKDSHDRYANVEVSYLLQQMEAYRGLAILTTNQKGALDQAFLRRLRYVVHFAFPDAAARARIWSRIFPRETPTEGLVPENLARLNLTGGAIRSVALNATYLAAAEDVAVCPAHVLRAARREYAKLEKPFTNSEMEAFR